MKSQQDIQPTKQQAPSSPIFVEAEKLFERMKEFSQSVARRVDDPWRQNRKTKRPPI